MTISNTTSIASFHQAISDAAVQRPTEEEAKLTKPEIKKAINLLPTTKAGVAAAVDVLENSTVRLTDGAKAHIQEFINAHQSAATEVVSDAPIFSSPLELRASLSSNSTDSIATLFGDTNYSRQMASQALADVGMAALSRADSVTLGDISDGPMGSFFVNIKISTFPNVNDIRADLRLQVNPDGTLIGASENQSSAAPTAPASPAAPVDSTDSIATLFGDTGYSRQMAGQALADVGMAALSRADSVTLGDISDGPMGSFFVNIKISTFPNVNDIRADLRLQVNPDGTFIGASEN